MSELVANNIRRKIVDGELHEGDTLPSEGQLMESFAISRPTLREAFRILEAERLISVVRGSRTGARVHAPQIENVSRYASYVFQSRGIRMSDIYEARLAIEPYAARRLAAHHDAAAVDRLRAEAGRLEEFVNQDRYVDFMIGLAGFHSLLVELAGNETLHFLVGLLQHIVAEHQVHVLQNREPNDDEQKRRALRGVKSFYRLIDLVERGQEQEAEDHWRLHVQNANADWVATDGILEAKLDGD